MDDTNVDQQLTGLIPGQTVDMDLTIEQQSDDTVLQYADETMNQSRDWISHLGEHDELYDFEDLDFRALEEYRFLVQLYHEYPKDMCVQHIVRKYTSSEIDLDRLRCLYFEHLKKVTDNLPFDQNCELKRRMFTRTGEPVAIRLAQDIYDIVTVIEGGDVNVLKSMVSVGKTRKSSVTKQNGRNAHQSVKSNGNCACSNELILIKDTVSSLQASVLLLKQSFHIIETNRSDQIESVKSGASKIKTDVENCARTVSTLSTSVIDSVRNMTCSLMERIVELEDRIRNTEVYLESVNIMPHEKTYSSSEKNKTNLNNDSNMQPFNNPEVNTIIDCNECNHDSNVQVSSIPESYTVLNCNLSADDEQTVQILESESSMIGQPIPIWTTNRDMKGVNELYDDFHVVTSKRVERFCVLGLSDKVNLKVLKSVIEGKGPSVKSIRMFPLRRNPRKVLIKLNLVANEYSGYVLLNNFWPDYVTCAQWLPRESLRAKYTHKSMDRSKPNKIMYKDHTSVAEKQRQTRDTPPRFRSMSGESSANRAEYTAVRASNTNQCDVMYIGVD
ncbi:hypothetical protein ACF0H5_024027 [Mactra antiquata]